jgi:beta-glucanase (GH16 family)
MGAGADVSRSSADFGLIDTDTPTSAYSMTTQTGETWELVFSDEFNTPGRTFWPGGA